MAEIKKKHINVILKLNCYMDVSIDEEVNPAPERIRDTMSEQPAYIMIGDAMILSEPDNLYMTVYNPDDSLLESLREISASEGMFVWKRLD
jgi:hypothetical protein